MDKITLYKKIAREIVTEIHQMVPDEEGMETQLVTDDLHGHYILFSVGWYDMRREYNAFLHLDVKQDGKVWVQHDGTDLKIAYLLIERGVAKDDVVLGFRQSEVRDEWREMLVA
jgi:hypothetical protein